MGSYSRSSSPAKSHCSAQDLDEDTSYGGAGMGALSPASALQLQHRGFEDIRLAPPTASPPRETISSRLLSNAPTAAAALSRSGSVIHSRARSLVAYAQKLNAGSTPTTPTEKLKQLTEEEDLERRSQTASPPTQVVTPRLSQANKFFGDFFAGESAPVQFGIPTSPSKDSFDGSSGEHIMEYRSEFTERPSHLRLQRTATNRSVSSNASSSTPTATAPPARSRTSWFGRRQSTPTKSSPPAASRGAPPSRPTTAASFAASLTAQQDPILALNVPAVLQPHGPSDSLNPQSFNALLVTATNLVEEVRAAYKEKAQYVASMLAEMEAQKEEVEETETRCQHLKIQLADVARKNEDQVRVNAELAEQLAVERMRVVEGQEREGRMRRMGSGRVHNSREMDVEEEDEESGREREEPSDDTTPRRVSSQTPTTSANKKRVSAGSRASDSGFESDADTSSVFSGAGGMTASSASSVFTSDSASIMSPPQSRLSVTSPPTADIYALRPAKNNGGGGFFSRPSLSRENSLLSHSSAKRLGTDSAAWATVEQLRAENARLRRQMADMQKDLQGCMDFVDGLAGRV